MPDDGYLSLRSRIPLSTVAAVNVAFSGENVYIILEGPSNAGKSHTMFKADDSIVATIAAWLFPDSVISRPQDPSCTVKCSFLEDYLNYQSWNGRSTLSNQPAIRHERPSTRYQQPSAGHYIDTSDIEPSQAAYAYSPRERALKRNRRLCLQNIAAHYPGCHVLRKY